jgi:hypothetical protein
LTRQHRLADPGVLDEEMTSHEARSTSFDFVPLTEDDLLHVASYPLGQRGDHLGFCIMLPCGVPTLTIRLESYTHGTLILVYGIISRWYWALPHLVRELARTVDKVLNGSMAERILVIEDEPQIADLLGRGLCTRVTLLRSRTTARQDCDE